MCSVGGAACRLLAVLLPAGLSARKPRRPRAARAPNGRCLRANRALRNSSVPLPGHSVLPPAAASLPNAVVGPPIKLPKVDSPTKEEVAKWHGKYIEARHQIATAAPIRRRCGPD